MSVTVNASLAVTNLTKIFYGSAEEKYGWILFYLFMLTYCLCTNVSIVAIIQHNPRFHTPHFLLMVFYSITDLLFCCSDSINKFIILARQMQAPMWYCQSASFLTSVTLLASIHLLGFISMERWVFFCKPYHYLKSMAMANIALIVGVIYTLSIMALGIFEVYYPRNSIRPATLSCVSEESNIFHNILFFGIYLFPSGAMTLFSLVQLFKLARRSQAIAPVPTSKLPPTTGNCAVWSKLENAHGTGVTRLSIVGLPTLPASIPNSVCPSPTGAENIEQERRPIPCFHSTSTINCQICDCTSLSQDPASPGSPERASRGNSPCRDYVDVIVPPNLDNNGTNGTTYPPNEPHQNQHHPTECAPNEKAQHPKPPTDAINFMGSSSSQVQALNVNTSTTPHTSLATPSSALSTGHTSQVVVNPTLAAPAISFPAHPGVGTKIPLSYKRVLKMILIVSGSFWLTFIPGFLISTWITASGVTWQELNARVASPRIVATQKFAYFLFYDLSKILNPLVIFYTHPQLRRGLRRLMGRTTNFAED